MHLKLWNCKMFVIDFLLSGWGFWLAFYYKGGNSCCCAKNLHAVHCHWICWSWYNEWCFLSHHLILDMPDLCNCGIMRNSSAFYTLLFPLLEQVMGCWWNSILFWCSYIPPVLGRHLTVPNPQEDKNKRNRLWTFLCGYQRWNPKRTEQRTNYYMS